MHTHRGRDGKACIPEGHEISVQIPEMSDYASCMSCRSEIHYLHFSLLPVCAYTYNTSVSL